MGEVTKDLYCSSCGQDTSHVAIKYPDDPAKTIFECTECGKKRSGDEEVAIG